MTARSLAIGVALCACAWLACAGSNTSAPNETGSEFSSAPQAASGGPGAPGGPGTPAAPNPDPWPRTLQLDGAQATVFQPQVESWQGNQLSFRCAVGVTPTGASDKTFGVIWASATTQVDRVSRMVTLTNVTLTRSNFPTAPDKGSAYLAQLQQQVPQGASTISLDRLEASLAAAGAIAPTGLPVRNDAPQVYVSYTPAILVPISGQPVVRPVPNTDFQRVINTRAAMLSQLGSSTWYLHVYDGWLQASAITGPWTIAMSPPMQIQNVVNDLAHNGQVDLLDGGNAQPRPSLANGAPAIFVSTAPSELIVFKGQPNFQPVGASTLLFATNTTADVFVDSSSNSYYVLLSGRWFRAPALNGPWAFVSSKDLPSDFANIPPGSPAGVVLASVAGTPQAREAMIANSIPQTAAVNMVNGPNFEATYDGAPKLAPIEGTPLQYVVNSPAPVIRVDANTWYALQAGVWFTATSPSGPWMIAASVPAVIYSIPVSSPLHYVTYVQVYGSGPGVVYVGYTPGYLGTVVAPDGVVVYGTGYAYDPWIGTVYYPPPPTYEVMAQPVYNPAVGWSYGFALGMTTAAMMDTWDEPTYYTSYYHGYPCCGSASANVYGHWGNTVTSGTQTWYSNSSGWMGEKGSGSYANYRTGTTGDYSYNRSVNPYTGQAQRGYDRSFDTQSGVTGDVSRQQNYNAQKDQTSYSSSMSAQGPGGSSVDRNVSASYGAGGDSVERTTTVDNARTGQTNTYSSGAGQGEGRYAGADGNTYHNDGSGWTNENGQSLSSNESSWADREQQARSAGDSRAASYQGGDWGGGGGGFGGGEGGGGDRFGGGGFGGGGGGGWGDHFGGGGFGGRFGGGGGFGGGRR
jgi:hypothetical protein